MLVLIFCSYCGFLMGHFSKEHLRMPVLMPVFSFNIFSLGV